MGKLFKDYCQGQLMLIPPSLEELIAADHPVRIVNMIIDQLDLEMLMGQYKGGGTTSYHPRMLLKVLVYGYLSNVYSSRKLEAAVCENIHFMWLAGMQRPDHNTINRFRSERLKEVVREVFSQVVRLLHESGHLSLQSVFTDGTKIEANANRYTFVWGKRITRGKEKMEQKIKSLWEYAESVAAEELKDQRPTTFEPIDPEQVQQTLDKIHTAIGGKKNDRPQETAGTQPGSQSLSAKASRIPAARSDPQRTQLLLQDRSRRDLHADEGGPHAKRSAQAGLQPADQHLPAVYPSLFHPSQPHRHHHADPPPQRLQESLQATSRRDHRRCRLRLTGELRVP